MAALTATLHLHSEEEVELAYHVVCQYRLIKKVSGFGKVVIPVHEGVAQYVGAEIVSRADLRPVARS